MFWVLYLLVATLLATTAALLLALRRAHRTISRYEKRERALTQQHKEQLSKASELDSLKNEFISTVSHELRTPLTSIRGALGLLSAGLLGNVDVKAQKLLGIAVNNTDRLVRLINDILDLERMDSGQVPLNYRRCSLRELAQQAAETMASMADTAGLRITLDPSLTSTPANFDGDSDRILQVLTNLLSNAIKFSPANTTITIAIQREANHLTFSIADQGRGIPSEKLETIFHRFTQVEPSDARQKGGSGLGLAICRSIIHQHGGTIWATSIPTGPGTTFLVRLPCVQSGQHSIASPLAITRSEASVLVCDDDSGIRTIVAEHLRRHSYNVVEASRGEEALALAADHIFDAILLDLYMPGLSGWETLRRLKDSPQSSNTPVVILSVLSPSERPQLIGDAQGWVQKPFDQTLLLSELARVLHASATPGHILLVEDDPDLAAVILTGFQQSSISATHAATRQAAIQYCSTHRPDLLLLDLTLPDGDGFSLVDWLRHQPDLQNLPLVVYSGREVTEDEMAKLRLGPTQFLTKARVQPHDVEELVLTMVRRLQSSPPSKD